jgi:type IV secretion system protein VirD4
VWTGVSIWLIIQSLEQLSAVYGRDRANILRGNCETQLYYRPNDLTTARYLEERLGTVSAYAHSQTLHDGQVVSEGRSEQAVPLLTARDISELDPDEIIVFHANRKPIRARRMDWRAFPILAQRRALPPPQLSALPPLEENPLSSPWRIGEKWPQAPIDPDAIN